MLNFTLATVGQICQSYLRKNQVNHKMEISVVNTHRCCRLAAMRPVPVGDVRLCLRNRSRSKNARNVENAPSSADCPGCHVLPCHRNRIMRTDHLEIAVTHLSYSLCAAYLAQP